MTREKLYLILYASEGTLSGYKPGEVVDLPDEKTAKTLLGFGVVREATPEDVTAAQEREDGDDEEAVRSQEGQEGASNQSQGETDPPADADPLEAELERLKTGGGWYTFPAQGTFPADKVQGQEAALAELRKRKASNAPASGE